ncbi:SDR family oxidoreductase, partial [Serratia fonticola]
GKASEVARITAFLIGDDSRYMTGQILVLDGGLTV